MKLISILQLTMSCWLAMAAAVQRQDLADAHDEAANVGSLPESLESANVLDVQPVNACNA